MNLTLHELGRVGKVKNEQTGTTDSGFVHENLRVMLDYFFIVFGRLNAAYRQNHIWFQVSM
jgi:hypothetical protein